MEEQDLVAYDADARVTCWCCDDCRAQEYARDVRELVAEVRRLRVVHYLPMDCPACGRHRLEYDPVAHQIRCEKCGSENWECPERAEVCRLRAEVDGLKRTQTVNAARVLGPHGTP